MATVPSKRKTYLLNQSPLYKLKSRRKLAELFGLTLKELESLANRQNNYRVFTIGKAANKPRQIQEPKPRVERLHRRLFNLLKRIESPTYLHSGIKGKSYITNAKEHIGADTLIALDIRKFFPSTLGWHVFEFYNEVMLCSKDVAGILTKISTYDNHIPTGSCLSQILAFYAHYRMFEEMNLYVKSVGLTMTCYVDDIAVSGDNANGSVLYHVRGILKRHGLVSHPRKEKIYRKGFPQEVTGSIVVIDGLRLPNRKHKTIHREIDLLLQQNDSEAKLKLLNVVVGRTVAASQSDSTLSTKMVALAQEKSRIKKILQNNTNLAANKNPGSTGLYCHKDI